MAQAPEFTPQQLAQAQKFLQQQAKAPKAGAIVGSKTINASIQTFSILNLSDDDSTISDKQFPKIKDVNQGLYVVSDADEEFLFLIEFREEIDLDSITFYCIQSPNEDEISEPKKISLFKVDSLNKDFDDVKDKKGDATFVCSKKKLQNGQTFSLKKKA
eukprot:510798_1